MLWHKIQGAGGVGGAYAPLVFRGQDASSADSTSYGPFTAPIGDAAAGRRLLIVATALGQETEAIDFLAPEVNGSSTGVTLDSHQFKVTWYNGVMIAWSDVLPSTGTTATVTIKFGGLGVFGMTVGAYTFGGTPTESSTVKPAGQTASGLFSSQALTVPTGGFGVWGAASQNGTNWAITGDATKDYGRDANSDEWGAAASITTAGSSSTTLSSTTTTAAIVFGKSFSIS